MTYFSCSQNRIVDPCPYKVLVQAEQLPGLSLSLGLWDRNDEIPHIDNWN